MKAINTTNANVVLRAAMDRKVGDACTDVVFVFPSELALGLRYRPISRRGISFSNLLNTVEHPHIR